MKLVADHDETLDMRRPENREITRLEIVIAKAIMEVLLEAYPGHPWAVRVDAKGSVCGKPTAILIKLPAVMRPQDHYVIPISRFQGMTFNAQKQLIRDAGGEILERLNLPRSGFLQDPMLEARELYFAHPNNRLPC